MKDLILQAGIFVDDILIREVSKEESVEILSNWRGTIGDGALNVSRMKTKYMCVGGDNKAREKRSRNLNRWWPTH